MRIVFHNKGLSGNALDYTRTSKFKFSLDTGTLPFWSSFCINRPKHILQAPLIGDFLG